MCLWLVLISEKKIFFFNLRPNEIKILIVKSKKMAAHQSQDLTHSAFFKLSYFSLSLI